MTSSDKAATLPTSISFVDGIATFLVTFKTSGSQTLDRDRQHERQA